MLKRKVLFILICVCASHAAGNAQTPVPDRNGSSKNGTFNALVTRLKGGDTAIDFKALRMASVDSNDEDAGAEADRDAHSKALSAFNAGKFKDAVREAEKALEAGYLDADAHLLVAVASEKLNDAKKFGFHKAVYLGLINSILAGADGQSAKTAYVVITVGEEYAVLRALNLDRGRQALRNEDGHSYDVLTVTDPKTKKTRDIWFNIDIVMQGYQKIFK
jgi:Domain of unknown function (DUF4919)